LSLCSIGEDALPHGHDHHGGEANGENVLEATRYASMDVTEGA